MVFWPIVLCAFTLSEALDRGFIATVFLADEILTIIAKGAAVLEIAESGGAAGGVEPPLGALFAYVEKEALGRGWRRWW